VAGDGQRDFQHLGARRGNRQRNGRQEQQAPRESPRDKIHIEPPRRQERPEKQDK
jgi:hypothetical protein